MTDPRRAVLAEKGGYLIEVAARAPSVHNTQPWRFEIGRDAIELYADPSRRLRVDPGGREMLISCGAALYGLRLAVRSLGYLPDVELLPESVELLPQSGAQPLARLRLGPAAPVTAEERKMLAAVPHRHTHRGPFEPGPLPEGLLPRLQDDVRAEHATLVVIDSPRAQRELAELVTAAAAQQDRDPRSRADIWQWTRSSGSLARDGVPVHAFPASPGHAATPAGPATPASAATPGRAGEPLPQRDFDLGRGVGWLTADGPAAPVTAALFTSGDGEREWLQAGQALDRLLLHAASRWVFARLNTQPLEDAATRTLVTNCLIGPGSLQLLLQLGVSRTAHATGRRPPADLTGPT